METFNLILNTVLSASFFYSLIRVATPLILATLGAVITSNAGFTNIAIEGVMLISALSAVLASAFGFGPWFGLFVAIIVGILCSMFIGYVSIKLKTDSALACIAFNTMVSGGTIFFMYAITGDKGTTIALNSGSLPIINIPIIQDIPVIGTLLSGHNIVSYFTVIMLFLTIFLLYKTPLGLRIRSAGKAPHALSSVGISVEKTRIIALAISGILGGLAGAFMSMGYVTWFSKDMTAGRGFIALAADAMGNSNPIGATLSAILFAFADALSYSMQLTAIPKELVQMIPYLTSIVGLVIFGVIRVKKVKKDRRKLVESEMTT